MSAVASSEFVPQQLTVEPDVTTTQNAKIKFLVPYFTEGGRLVKSPTNGKSSTKPSGGLFISRTFLRGGGGGGVI